MNKLISIVRPGQKLLYGFVLLVGLCLAGPAFSQCTWYPDGDGDGFGTSNNSISASCSSIPAGYVSNALDCNDNSVNTTAWTPVGAVGSGIVNATKIVIGPDGTPFILYRHRTDPAPTKIITVKKFTGGNWVTLGTDPISISDYMLNADLAVGPDGVPYVSFVDADMGDKVTVLKYDDVAGTWNVVGARAFSADPVINNGMASIAVDKNNVPYVLFVNTSFQAFVMKYDAGTGWQEVGTGSFAMTSGAEYDMAIDENGVPYVTLADELDGEVTVMRFGATGWEVVGARSFSDGYVIAPQIATDRNNVPYVAYYDGVMDAVVVQRYGSAWAKVGTAAFSGTAYNFAIAIDNLGVPYVVYREEPGGEITTIRWNGVTWQVVANDKFAVGLEVSIAIGPNNIPYVSCKDIINSDWAMVRITAPVASPPDMPTLTATKSTVCSAESTTLTATGDLNDATAWKWYTGSCGGVLAGTGPSITVNPTTTTTYFVRGEGSCVSPPGGCTSITVTVNPRPSITTPPVTTAAVCEGENGSLSVTATGSNIGYQWYEDRNDGNGWSILAGRTNSSLPLTAVTASMTNYKYQVIVRNTLTQCTSASAGSTLTVNTLPVITIQPVASTTLCENGGATLSVSVAGANMAYQWHVNTGTTWASMPGQVGSTLALSNVAFSMDGYRYRVVITNSVTNCSSTSAISTLRVNTPSSVTLQPQDVTICANGKADFSAAATGSNITYQWQEDRGAGFTSLADGGVYSGVTTAALSITGVTALMNSYRYRVVIQNAGCTSSTSLTARLTVNTTPAVTAQPSNATVCAGANASFNVVASGNNLTYQWQEDRGSGFTNLSDAGLYSGTTTATLLLTGTSDVMDGYRYRVDIRNTGCSVATTNGLATLRVNTAPAVTTQPSAATICSGSNASFNVVANGSNLTYQWQEDRGTGFTNISNGGVYSGATTSVLTITAATQAMNAYKYKVSINNTGCNSSASDGLAVLRVDNAPTVTTQPSVAPLCEGGNANLNVVANGSNLTYQWREDRGSGFTDITNGGVYSGATSSSLTIMNATTLMDGYKYMVSVSNTGCGSVTSDGVAEMTVDTAPAITTHPLAASACSGANATFGVVASGSNLRYQWERNSGSGWSDLPGEANDGLNLTSVAPVVTGYQYRVRIVNDGCLSITSNEAVLTVDTAPSLVNSPVDAPVCVGAAATFNSVASGTNLNYQWQQDNGSGWSDLTGETSATLSLSNVDAAMDNYQYRIIVGNEGCGEVNSAPATLVVNTSSGITAQPEDVHSCEGIGASFTVTAQGTNLRYQWQRNRGGSWENVAGETRSALAIASIDAGMDGYSYRVVIDTDGCPSIFSDIARLSANEAPVLTVQPTSVITCVDTNVSFTAGAEGTDLTYQWQVNDGSGWADMPGEALPLLAFQQVTAPMNGNQYRVVVSNIGCPPVASVEALLTVNTEPGTTGCLHDLLVSEGLSPNGDSELDYWVIQGIERYPNNKVKLYNVWGDLVYEQSGYANEVQAWRGESNRGTKVGGQQAPEGTYYYMIDLGDNSSLLRGFVVLKR